MKEKYYIITNKEEEFEGLKLKDGLNEFNFDIEVFKYKKEHGKNQNIVTQSSFVSIDNIPLVSFSTQKSILYWASSGYWIREVEIPIMRYYPHSEETIEFNNVGTFLCKSLFLGKRKKINSEIIEKLLEKSENKEWHYYTLFSLACNLEDVEMAKMLISRGAIEDIYRKDCGWFTHAISIGNIDMISALIDGGVDVNQSSWSPLAVAVELKNYDLVEYLISRGANVNSAYTGFSRMCRDGNIEGVKFLVEHGLNIKDRENTWPIEWASQFGHMDIVKFLIENGSKVDSDDCSVLETACENGHIEIVELLLKNGANANPKSGRPLECAVKNGHCNIIEMLLKNGADPGVRGGTPVYIAMCNGSLMIANMLIHHGNKVLTN